MSLKASLSMDSRADPLMSCSGEGPSSVEEAPPGSQGSAGSVGSRASQPRGSPSWLSSSFISSFLVPERERVPTFMCPICAENVRVEDRFVLAACGLDDHGCCRQCLSTWVKGLIKDGQVGSLVCPILRCGSPMMQQDVRELTDNEIFVRYERFIAMRQDETLRECPQCNELCRPDVRSNGEPIPEMSCKACKATFCFFHSNAHAGQQCAAYRLQLAKEERQLAARFGTKLCPHCGINTDKISGCNHMTCHVCRQNWCWACGQALPEEYYFHYAEDNALRCPQWAHDTVPYAGLMRFLRCFLFPIVVLTTVLFWVCVLTMPAWAVTTVITGPLFCFKWKPMSIVIEAFAFLPIFLFQVAWLPLGCVLQLHLLPFGGSWYTFRIILRMPFFVAIGLRTHLHDFCRRRGCFLRRARRRELLVDRRRELLVDELDMAGDLIV